MQGEHGGIREAIDIIRDSVVAGLAEYPDGDPWDEEQHGANWIENSFFYFLEIWCGLNGIIRTNISTNFSTVRQYEFFLNMFSQQVISSFYHFEMSDGTSNRTFREFTEILRSGQIPTEELKRQVSSLLFCQQDNQFNNNSLS
jgi:hypothetical protein